MRKKLEIPKYDANGLVTGNIRGPIFKAILKYKNQASILSIQKYVKIFHF